MFAPNQAIMAHNNNNEMSHNVCSPSSSSAASTEAAASDSKRPATCPAHAMMAASRNAVVVDDEIPTMIELAHRIHNDDDDIDSISDCSSCGDDEDETMLDLQPIPVVEWDADQAILLEAIINDRPSLHRQTSSHSIVPSIISFEHDDPNKSNGQHIYFSSSQDEIPRLVVSENDLEMDDRSIATFSLVDEDQAMHDLIPVEVDWWNEERTGEQVMAC